MIPKVDPPVNEVDAKYHADGPFNDPVVRCDKCQRLLLMTGLHKQGKCCHCGNTRVANVNQVTANDMETLIRWADDGIIDSDFIKLFEKSAVQE